jgi:TRAP-type C4-dicarboxylate transport system permease small subunit
MKTLEYLGKLFDVITDALAFIAGVILILIMISVSLDVVMRYFLKAPMLWVDELSEYGLLYITFMGTAWLLKQEGHVAVDLIDNVVSLKGRKRLTIFSSVVGMFVCAVVTYFGVEVTWSLFARGIYNPTMLEIPRGVLVAVIPLGTFLLCVQFVRRIVASLIDSGRR